MIDEISLAHPVSVLVLFLPEHREEVSSCALKPMLFIVLLDRAQNYLQ
jgi:hypothetical protein